MTRAFVALGSNLNEPVKQIEEALAALSVLADTTLVACSPLYRNEALGSDPQPVYVNGVAELRTGLGPHALLDALQAIEAVQGRTRGGKCWRPRTIDLDILLYGDMEIRDDRLEVPHPEMHRRRFVLEPLRDLAADLSVPGRGPLRDLIERAPPHGLIRIAPDAPSLKAG
jgi:2-amino-4-hydroxy-6-hydroxymethyldihydropteridine diphosphokinase